MLGARLVVLAPLQMSSVCVFVLVCVRLCVYVYVCVCVRELVQRAWSKTRCPRAAADVCVCACDSWCSLLGAIHVVLSPLQMKCLCVCLLNISLCLYASRVFGSSWAFTSLLLLPPFFFTPHPLYLPSSFTSLPLLPPFLFTHLPLYLPSSLPPFLFTSLPLYLLSSLPPFLFTSLPLYPPSSLPPSLFTPFLFTTKAAEKCEGHNSPCIAH